MKQFFEKNKVLILGGLSSIAVALSSFIGQDELQVKVLVFAGITGLLSYIANTLRGQWVSIAGILTTLATTVFTQSESGKISWAQISLQAFVALMAIVAPPAKPLGYERSAVIEKAKSEGEKIQTKLENSHPPQL